MSTEVTGTKIKFVHKKNPLPIIIDRAISYNRVLFSYVRSYKGKIPVPVDDLKKVADQFSSVNEYIRSEDKWVKLLEFDDSQFTFDDYISLMIRNWIELKTILGIEGYFTPKFSVLLSPKITKFYWVLTKREKSAYIKDSHYVTEDSRETMNPTFGHELYAIKDYINRHQDMTITEILDTFSRDFSDEFIEKVKKKNPATYSDIERIFGRDGE